jgi:hypothetical protein
MPVRRGVLGRDEFLHRSIAARSFARDPTTDSIASHTTARGTVSPQVSASNSTWMAADSTPACRACPCARRSVALSELRPARPISSPAINTSNSSRASSVAVTSSHRTVANRVAILRWCFNAASFGAFASNPIRASSINRRVGTPVLATIDGYRLILASVTSRTLVPKGLFPSADGFHDGTYPRHERFIGDEFAGIDTFPFASTEISLAALNHRILALAKALLESQATKR